MTSSLSSQDLRRLEKLFERAAGLPPAEHEAFLARECGSSDAVRDELERLLAGLAGEDLLARYLPGAPLPAGTRIGPYLLAERIGQGGMGEVYAAEQEEPIRRRVALKVIKPGMDSAQVVARFHAERQALARMAHPHVAQVFDAGATEDGRPYFAMEYVAGEAITAYCDRRRLSTRARIELFLDVCGGRGERWPSRAMGRESPRLPRISLRSSPASFGCGAGRGSVTRSSSPRLRSQSSR